jgi:hypothetical protein
MEDYKKCRQLLVRKFEGKRKLGRNKFEVFTMVIVQIVAPYSFTGRNMLHP